MKMLGEEIDSVVQNEYCLNFKYPTLEEINQIRRVHRDMHEDERLALKNDLDALARITKRILEGELDLNNLPEDVRGTVQNLMAGRAK